MVADAGLTNLVKVQQGHARLYVLGHFGERDSHDVCALSQLLEVLFAFIFDPTEHCHY